MTWGAAEDVGVLQQAGLAVGMLVAHEGLKANANHSDEGALQESARHAHTLPPLPSQAWWGPSSKTLQLL